MNYKSLIAATAVASLPMMASATTVEAIDHNGTTNVPFDTIYEFDVQIATGRFSHTFIVDSDAEGVGQVSLTDLIANVFTGLTVSWSNGATGGANELVTTDFVDPGSLTQTLDITWDSTLSSKDFDGAVQISAVPVPAGLLLMGTALAGLGVMRRKK